MRTDKQLLDALDNHAHIREAAWNSGADTRETINSLLDALGEPVETGWTKEKPTEPGKYWAFHHALHGSVQEADLLNVKWFLPATELFIKLYACLEGHGRVPIASYDDDWLWCRLPEPPLIPEELLKEKTR